MSYVSSEVFTSFFGIHAKMPNLNLIMILISEKLKLRDNLENNGLVQVLFKNVMDLKDKD